MIGDAASGQISDNAVHCTSGDASVRERVCGPGYHDNGKLLMNSVRQKPFRQNTSQRIPPRDVNRRPTLVKFQNTDTKYKAADAANNN